MKRVLIYLAVTVPLLWYLFTYAAPESVPPQPAADQAPKQTAPPDTATAADAISFASEIPSVRSLLIWQRDSLLAEEYFRGRTPGSAMNIKSASKSIISLLVGIAVDEGFLESVDQPIAEWFPEYFERDPDSLKRTITIEDLLTMRAGLETTSSRNYGRWVLSDNWVEFALSQPIDEEPGGRMVYSTGSSHLLSVILTKATGMTTRAFAQRYLFNPLDITPGGWDRDPQGYYMGGNNLALRSSDLLKIGQMVLAEGRYGGQQIVSASWLEDSFRTYTRSNYNPYDYGYMWWKRPLEGYEVRFAWGHGGQYIFIFPALDAVAVVTSTVGTGGSRRYRRDVFDMLEDTVIPLLRSR